MYDLAQYSGNARLPWQRTLFIHRIGYISALVLLYKVASIRTKPPDRRALSVLRRLFKISFIH